MSRAPTPVPTRKPTGSPNRQLWWRPPTSTKSVWNATKSSMA
jgi:hypothetical protein